MKNLIETAWSAYREERAMMWGGLLGLALSGVCFLIMLVRGQMIPPEGDLMKAATFDGAVGIYFLTIALVVQVAGLSRVVRHIWRWTAMVFILYGYPVETIQILRGIDPRFTRAGTEIDQALGVVFFVTAVSLTVSFVILAVPFLIGRADSRRPLLALAVRYGMYATAMAFAGGFVMVAVQGRTMGAAGNLLPIHAAGFHALQAVPLVALLAGRSAMPADAKRRLVHLAGLVWIGLCVTIGWQTLLGRPLLEPGPAPLAAAAMLPVWMGLAARAGRAFAAARS